MGNILHVLASGDIGGIEVLCKDIGKFSRHVNTFCFLWRGGLIEKEMSESGLQSYIIGIEKNTISAYIKAYKRLAKYIKMGSYDCVVFHHSAPLMWIFLPLIKQKFKTKFVVLYSHNNYANLVKLGQKSSFVRQKLFSYAYHKADAVISISKSVRNSVISYLPNDESKNVVIYNGVNTDKFYVVDRIKLKGKMKIAYVGRITKEKGVQILIKALARIEKEKYIADIYGDGPYIEEVKRLVITLGLEDSIFVHGATREVERCMAEADIFVHPALWEEGFGITLVEAMSSGLVVVAAEVGAVSEIIEDKKNGFIFSKGNDEQLASVLDCIMDMDSVELDCIRSFARQRGLEFSIQKMADKFDAFLQNGIEGAEND